ncbi:hypothetical protein CVT24_007976 [Panaeolus cyanescens]|uniref:F-box domain-containing protein n=1 Tax=Panaeolus cyanescens TaxID=181874 RepID=A0A409YQT8_9AGAR|nr:hypothetical protein CVT24_007976 [Panaeolus cyanescens]
MPSKRLSRRRRVANISHSLFTTLKSFLLSPFTIKSQTSAFHPDPTYQSTSNNRATEISRPHRLRPSPHIYPGYQALHLIHLLPFEILSHIFVLGSEEDALLPVSVSHVCRKWRKVALRTPSLWRIISLNSHERMWHERIRRARACSLDVILSSRSSSYHSRNRHHNFNPSVVQNLMHIAIPYIDRWRSLEVAFTEYVPCLWMSALSGCNRPAPSLQELCLIYSLNDDTSEITLFSGVAPRLKRLTVDGIRLNWLPSLFANLTYLDYTHHGFTSGHRAVHDVISILGVSSRIRELHILFPRTRSPCLPQRKFNVAKRISLPHLTTLSLKVDGTDIPFELAHFITLISTPSLTALKLVDLRHSSQSFPSLKPFFYVYALPPTLRQVHISYGWYDPFMVRPMAQSLPRMGKITIKRLRLPEQVLMVNPAAKRHSRFPVDRINLVGAPYHRRCSIDRLPVSYRPPCKAF